MLPQIKPLEQIIRLNVSLFKNCLAGVTDDIACKRPNDRTNNIAFIALHVVNAWYHIARCLSLDIHDPFEEQYKHVASVDQCATFPPVAEMITAWENVSSILSARCELVSEEELVVPSKIKLSGCDQTVLDELTFLVQHESYHIGQL